MQRYYISSVTLKKSRVQNDPARILEIQLCHDDKNKSNLGHTARLYGNEDVSKIDFDPGVRLDVKPMVLNVVQDLIQTVGNGEMLDFSVPDLDKRIENFELLWKRRTFANELKAYNVIEKLSFEQAKAVLEEYYVVEPIMES